MACEGLRVDNQETIECLQREAESLKKKLEDEKAKLGDVLSVYLFEFISINLALPCCKTVVDIICICIGQRRLKRLCIGYTAISQKW